MTWQASVILTFLGLTFLFYWLSFEYDRKEHLLLKFFYTMMGWIMAIATILVSWLLIPTTETKLLAYYDAFLWITFILLILVFLYWLFYISLSIGKGLLKNMWGDLRSLQSNPRNMRFYFGGKKQS